MSEHYDYHGLRLHAGDFVRTTGIINELFRIKEIRFEGAAVIENVLPGGRLGPSSIPCTRLMKAISSPAGKPPWFDDTYEPFAPEPLRGTELPCGCYLRKADLQAVLCEHHLIEVNR